MKHHIIQIILGIILTISFVSVHAEGDTLHPVTLGASYTGDVVSNFKGGIKTRTTYLGLLHLTAELNTDGFKKLWKGGSLFINASNTHGGMATQDLIGDFQGLSNIEAGNHTYLQEFWFRQKFDNFEVTAGIQDLNVEYVVCDHAGYYLNSSFGVPPTISSNIPAPIFPITALGLTLKWDISDSWVWKASAFDGDPTDFEKNPHNLNWKLSKQEGMLSISEFQYTVDYKKYGTGIYKMGGFYHSHNEEAISENERKYGFYMIACHDLLINEAKNRNIQAFVELSGSPLKTNLNYAYIGGGLNFCRFLPFKFDNVIGIGFSQACLRNMKNEIVFELNCKIDFNSHFYIQPDFQLVLNPASTGVSLPNAWVGLFRFGVKI